MTQPGRSLPYLPGLDGLRALAVSAVLVYHAGNWSGSGAPGIQWMRGGYLGVEVFFVISGYLITSLLLIERRSRHTTDLAAFWLRRARRLLPALYTLIAFWTTYAVVFLRDEVERLRGDVIAGLVYVTNWYQISTASYGGNAAEANGQRPSLFKHLWSLAVEEQYYILWPIAFAVLIVRLGRGHTRRLVIGLSITAAIWMAALSTFSWLPGHPDFSLPIDNHNLDPTRIYEGTDTRAAGLLLGSWLAFVWAPARIRGHVGRGAPVVLDLAAVAALVWLFRLHQTTEFKGVFLYRGGMYLIGILTCIVIVTVVHPASHVGLILGNPLFRWIGLRSYGIYLWHWPIYQVTRPGLDIGLDGVANLVLRLVLTLAAAEVSYRYVEMPVRQGRLGDWWYRFRHDQTPMSTAWRRRWVTIIAASSALFVATGAAVWAAEPVCPPDDPTGCRQETESAISVVTFAPTVPTTRTTLTGTTSTDPSATTVPGVTAPTTAPSFPSNILAIGDSVMLGASPTLQENMPGIVVDAAVSRAPIGGLAHLEDIARLGGLRNVQVVVIHLGTNGNWGAGEFDRMMATLRDVPLVVVLNARMPRSWERTVNRYLARETKGYANVVLVDWHTIGNEPVAIAQGWFYADGFHLKPGLGRDAYANAIRAAITRRLA
jgi:peptidoglycan/LPS O-acetylase OafA/YrhL